MINHLCGGNRTSNDARKTNWKFMKVCARDVKMTERMRTLVLLSCIVYQVSSMNSFSTDPCYAIKDDVRIKFLQKNLTEDKFWSEIQFLSENINISRMNGEWKPCSTSHPPLTNNTFQQIRTVLNLLHLTDETISCDQLNKLYSLKLYYFSFAYYSNLGNVLPAVDQQGACEYALERLEIRDSPDSLNKVIRNESFCQFKKLRVLHLVWNDIWEIAADAFICLEHLIEIDLKSNNLNSLPREVFRRNQRLRTVILSANRFTSTLFSSFPPSNNVVILELNDNEIETLSEVIPLRRLKRLDLRGNKLREINRNAFSQLAELEDVDLSNNKLAEFHAETFRNNAKVKSLNVSNNALKNIPKIDNLLKLQVLRLDYNQISGWINLWDLFNNHIDLKDLSLNDNEIEGIVESSMIEPKPLTETLISNLSIDLSNNRIQSLRNVILPNRVTWFDVKYNRIQTACVSSLRFTSEPKVENVLRLAGNPLRCNCVNSEIKLFSNQKLISDFANLECDLVTTPLNPGKQRKVNLAKLADEAFLSRIEFNSSEQCVCDGKGDCSSNTPNEHCYAVTDKSKSNVIHVCENLTQIPSRGYYSASIIRPSALYTPAKHYMYFNGNNIEKLSILHLYDIRISIGCVLFYLEKSNVQIIKNDAFNQFTNLEVLSLRNNRIRVLPDNLFLSLKKLKELYLSNNRLITLSSPTINVIKLELHNNSLTHLPIITNTNKLLLSSHNLTNLSLHDNPWSCECEFIQPFHYYLGNNTDIVQRIKEINCTDEQRNHYNALQFDLSKCKPFLHLTAVVTSTTFAVVIITIAVLIFIYRREVRVLIYSHYHLRIFGPEVEDDVSSKQYDAFVAYNSKDEDFLVNHLMPGLEAIPNPYRLCIHERDFPGGAFIQDSIMQAVQLSSRTIVLLSENFVESGWCRMEFMTAHAQMLQDRCPRVLLIVLGEIPQNLDPEMELYLRTNTYLRWGERLFWKKLYYAMPDQRVTTPPTDIMPMYQL